MPHHYPMPRMETELPNLAASTCFVNFDLCHGYWKLDDAKQSREFESFITPTESLPR